MSECGSGSGEWEARNKEKHLCGQDLYSASWRFGRGVFSEDDDEEGKGDVWWEVRYDVKGPKKDYVSETRYVRA